MCKKIKIFHLWGDNIFFMCLFIFYVVLTDEIELLNCGMSFKRFFTLKGAERPKTEEILRATHIRKNVLEIQGRFDLKHL